MSKIGLLTALAHDAVSCSVCFDGGSLRRSFVDLPQPRYVGPGYWDSGWKVAFLMLNPGAGTAEPRNCEWRAPLHKFRREEASLTKVFEVQRRHMPYWSGGRLIRFVQAHGLDMDELALVNMAWCATKDNKYPSRMLSTCLANHTLEWLRVLAPNTIILSGTATHGFEEDMRRALPWSRVLKAYHYAHRPRDGEKAMSRAEEIRAILNDEK